MTKLEHRPRFKIESKLAADEVIKKIRNNINNENIPCDGSVVTNHAVLRIPQNQAHFWSPELSLDISKSDNGTLIRGLFGPNPSVWTLFMFFYMGVGFMGLIGLFYGLSQWTLGNAPIALWSVPIAISLEIIIYFIAQTGKKLANSQMIQLNSIFEQILKEPKAKNYK